MALATRPGPGARRVTPLAVLASSDLRAIDAIRTAGEAGTELPRSMALLGLDNDAVLTRLCRPNLSSIVTDNPRIGREADQSIRECRPPASRRATPYAVR